jgi:hypothetical protein
MFNTSRSSNAALATVRLLSERLPLFIYSSSSILPACVESEVVPNAFVFHACTPVLGLFDPGDAGFLGVLTCSCGIPMGCSDASRTGLP